MRLTQTRYTYNYNGFTLASVLGLPAGSCVTRVKKIPVGKPEFDLSVAMTEHAPANGAASEARIYNADADELARLIGADSGAYVADIAVSGPAYDPNITLTTVTVTN